MGSWSRRAVFTSFADRAVQARRLRLLFRQVRDRLGSMLVRRSDDDSVEKRWEVSAV